MFLQVEAHKNFIIFCFIPRPFSLSAASKGARKRRKLSTFASQIQ